MKRAMLVMAAAALAGGCKKNSKSPATTGSGSSMATTSGSNDAGSSSPAAAAPAVLEFEALDAEADQVLKTAFGSKMPKLPAVNVDGSLIASLVTLGGMPMSQQPGEVRIAKLPSGDIVQTLPVLEIDEAIDTEQAGDNWLTPALQKKLQERGAAVLKRLDGFHTLMAAPIAINSNGDPQPTKIGELTLTSEVADDDTLMLMLRDGKNKLLQRERIETFTEGERGEAFENAPCIYRPTLNGAYRDPAKRDALYIEVGYRFAEGCDESHPTYLGWSTDPRAASPEAEVADLVARQFDLFARDDKTLPEIATADVLAVDKNSVVTMNDFSTSSLPGFYDGHEDHQTTLELSRDGTSAWASTLTTVRMGDLKHGDMPQNLRASDVLVKTPKGWRIAVFAWTEATPNAKANRDAKAGKLVAGKLAIDPGDAGLRDAFAKMTTDGLKNVAPDLVAIGSGPGERTVGGPGFAKAWNAAWKGKTTIVSSVARLMPGGTTGWVAATVELAKSGYKIPFTVFSVFDKAADGSWALVHIHFVT